MALHDNLFMSFTEHNCKYLQSYTSV